MFVATVLASIPFFDIDTSEAAPLTSYIESTKPTANSDLRGGMADHEKPQPSQ